MQVQRYLRLVLIIAFLSLLSSCITIEEKYTFNADGSGIMEYIIDMSELKSMIPDEGDEGGSPLGDEEEDSFEADSIALSSIDGIDQIQRINDEENFRFGWKFRFGNLSSLNKALNQVLETEVGDEEHTFITKEGNAWTRHAGPKGMDLSELLGDMGEESPEGMDMGSLLANMNYKQTFTFSQDIQTVYAQDEVDMGSETVVVSTDLKQLAENPTLLGSTIVVKK